MYLDFFDTIELDESNRDIYDYTKKQGCLDFEIADMLELAVDEYRLWLSEPLDENDKRRIAKAAKAVVRNYRYDDAVYDDYVKTSSEKQRIHDIVKYCKTNKCMLNMNRKYTGQFRNYESCGNQWDA